MAQCLFICDVNLSIEEDLSMLLVKEYDLKTHIKGYYPYMTKWTPKNGEILKVRTQPEKEYEKYAVAVETCGDVVGHLSKGRSARFAKTISYFLPASNEGCYRVEVTGKRVNSGDGEGLQIPYILHFSGEAKFVSKLKDILPQCKNQVFVFIFFPIVTVYVRKFGLARAFFGQRPKKNVQISEKLKLSEFGSSSIKHRSLLMQTQGT